MSRGSSDVEAGGGSGGAVRFEPHLVAVIVTWLAATGTLAVMLWMGVGGTGRFPAARHALHFAYVAALLWSFVRSGPPLGELPPSPLGLPANGRWWRGVAVGMALVLCLTGLLDAGLFLLLLAAATIVILVAWRRMVTVRAVGLGFAASALAFVAGGIAFWRFGFVGKPVLVFMLIAVPPMFVAGGLLVARTGVGAVRVLEGRYGAALRSFLLGCVLFVPLGLANAADSVRPGLTWVDKWWHPIALPLWSGIVEEVVFRTVVVCLCYALVRPVLKRSPASAIVLAVLFSAVVFGLGHGRTWGNLLFAGMGYGLPMAAVFAQRDWERAVGAHYMVNMIPWVMAFLAT